ncbi:hypothetical protein Tco_1409308 [Tanacetum coccineum]
MEIDTTPSSPTLMTSVRVPTGEEGREIEGGPQPTSNITSSSQAQFITPVHPDMQAVDEAFVVANYSQLERLMRKGMKELRLQGVVTQLNYSSEDVDEEREMEAPPGYRSQPPGGTEGQGMEGIPLLLVAHLRETEKEENNSIAKRSPECPRKPWRPWEFSRKKSKERRDKYNPYKEHNPGILQTLTKSPREILTTEKVGKTFIKPPKMISKARDTSKYCEFHQDYDHDTNACREMKRQIEEAVKSRKLAHLVKGIRKWKAKLTDTQLGEWVTPAIKTEPVAKGKEEPILMIGVICNPLKRKEPPKIMSVDEMIFPPIQNRAPSVDPLLIIVRVYGRQVGRVLVDGGAACDIIYEHCLLKLQKEVRERRKDVYTTLSGFFGEQVNPLGEISLLITVGEAPHHIRMIPSTMHSAVLYQSEDGPRVIMFEYQDIRRCEQVKRLKESLSQVPLEVSECVNPDEKIIINQKYPKQAITIGRQLPPHFKKELVKLLRNNADIFAWEYSDMTRIPKTLKIGSEVFVTEHKLNENKKITLVPQKKRGMGPERSDATSKEVEELKKDGILRET